MTPTTTDTMLRISRMISGSQDDVFDAWTKPELVKKWSSPQEIGRIESEIDLRVGGSYTLKMIDDKGNAHTAYGVYRTIERPSKLVYTWDWKEDHKMGVETLVTVDFISQGEATEVIITHELFPAAEATAGHLQGWESCMNRLEELFG